MQIDALGDRAILVTLGDIADSATRLRVRACYERLLERPPTGVTDIVPGFASIVIHYDPTDVGQGEATGIHAQLAATIERLLRGAEHPRVERARLVELPVCYDESLAPDLGDVAAHAGLTAGQLVDAHVAAEYVVHMVGFLPGFPYLGGLDPRLTTPRRSSPRTRVPAGSVGIGGSQTGVYPIESPGGWQLIGRTPTRLFDVGCNPPALLCIGDRVRFVPLSLAEYQRAVRA